MLLGTNGHSQRCVCGGPIQIALAADETISPQAQLILPALIRHTLLRKGIDSAVVYTTHHAHFAYFSYALELLLHLELERIFSQPSQVTSKRDAPLLYDVIVLLDHFEPALEVIAACARKMEMKRWPVLFDVAGSPRDLFEVGVGKSQSAR